MYVLALSSLRKKMCMRSPCFVYVACISADESIDRFSGKFIQIYAIRSYSNTVIFNFLQPEVTT